MSNINTEFIDDDAFLELDKVLSQAEASRKIPTPTNTPPKVGNYVPLVVSPPTSFSKPNFPSVATSPNKQQLLHQKINQTPTSAPVVLPTNTNIPQTLNVPFTVDVLLESKERFSATTPLQEPVVQVYRSIAGQNYDYDTKKWTFPLTQYRNFVYKLRSIKGVNVKEFPGAIINTFIDKKNIRNENVALDKLPTSLLDSLFPYQKSGVVFGIQKGGKILIADEMGLGKTIQAIALALYYRSEWPCLIIVPSSVRLQWADQFEKWAPDISQDDINVVMTGKGICNKLVNIISYDLVVRLESDISSRKFQVVVADESHLLKTYNTKRTMCITPIIEGARRSILLSGTPALSRPKELYTQVRSISPNLLPKFHDFGIRYCGGYFHKFAWNYDGATNLNELHLLLENTIMIRRLKDNVLSELPEKQRFQVLISVEKKHNNVLNKISKELKEAKKNYSNASSRAESKEPGSEKRRLILELYKDLGISKLTAINQYIKEIIENEESKTKYLIFGHHLKVLDGICSTLKAKSAEYVRIDGKTPSHQRYEFAKIFQTDANCKFAVLSMTAAGVGLNLTAANVVIFTELFWNPGTLRQCEDRAHRIGQTRGVEIRYLTAKGTMDEVLWKMIERKLSIIGETLNGEQDTIDASLTQFESNGPIDSYLDEFLEQLETFAERNSEIKSRKERRKKRQSLAISAELDDEEDQEEEEQEDDFEEPEAPKVKQPKKRKSNPIVLEDSEEELQEEGVFKLPSNKSGIIEVEDEFEESQEFTKEQAEEKEKLALSKFSKFTYTKPLNF